jgi:hypothetical protein
MKPADPQFNHCIGDLMEALDRYIADFRAP